MLRTQALAIAVLGMWIGINLAVWFAATRTFSTAERVVQSPGAGFSRAVRQLAKEDVREALRYLASEINRTYFRVYGWAQVVLGIILFILVWQESPRAALDLTLVGVMLALALVLTFVITPWISSLGRSLDFVPRNPAPPEMSRFWMLHGAFTGLDSIKLLIGFFLAGRWIISR